MSKIFFYGLFMKRSLLTEKGLHPEIIGPAVLPHYRIHIGERATLLPSDSSRAYGILMELADQQARVLYSEASVCEYVRERIQVERLDTNEVVEAYCYNLPRELGLAGANPAYALALSELVAACVKAETGVAPELSTSGGTSDARFVKDHCPVVEFGLVGKTMHAVDERVEIDQIHQLKRIYSRILRDYFA